MILKISGKKWKVSFKKKVTDSGKDLGGTTDTVKKEIDVCVETAFSKPSEHIEEISRIFYHEFIHAIFHESDMRDQSWWNADTEHLIIAAIAKAMAENLPLRVKLK
jgi:hypothetical protein